MAQHIAEAQLEAYSRQILEEKEVVAVEEHLLVCSQCQDELETVERFQTAMKTAARRVQQEENEAAAHPGLMDWMRNLVRVPLPILGTVAVVAVMVVAGTRMRQPVGPPVEVELQALRGGSELNVPAGHQLNLHLDSRGLPEAQQQFPLEIVDAGGSKVWSGTGTAQGNSITAKVAQTFRPGTFFIRVLKPGSDPLREYQLIVVK